MLLGFITLSGTWAFIIVFAVPSHFHPIFFEKYEAFFAVVVKSFPVSYPVPDLKPLALISANSAGETDL